MSSPGTILASRRRTLRRRRALARRHWWLHRIGAAILSTKRLSQIRHTLGSHHSRAPAAEFHPPSYGFEQWSLDPSCMAMQLSEMESKDDGLLRQMWQSLARKCCCLRSSHSTESELWRCLRTWTASAWKPSLPKGFDATSNAQETQRTTRCSPVAATESGSTSTQGCTPQRERKGWSTVGTVATTSTAIPKKRRTRLASFEPCARAHWTWHPEHRIRSFNS